MQINKLGTLLSLFAICSCTFNRMNVFSTNSIDLRLLKQNIKEIKVVKTTSPKEISIKKVFNLIEKDECLSFIDYLEKSKISKTDDVIFGDNINYNISFVIGEETKHIYFNNNVCNSLNGEKYIFNDYKNDFGLDNPTIFTNLPQKTITSYNQGNPYESINNNNDNLEISYSNDYTTIDRTNECYYLAENPYTIKIIPLENDNYLFDEEVTQGNVFKIPDFEFPSITYVPSEICNLRCYFGENNLTIQYKRNDTALIWQIRNDMENYLRNCKRINLDNFYKTSLYLGDEIIRDDLTISNDIELFFI